MHGLLVLLVLLITRARFSFQLKLPLREAANRVYENTEKSFTTRVVKIFADMEGLENSSIVDYFAGLIVETAEKVEVPLFGKEPPSRKSREIDKSNFGEFKVEGNDVICTSPRHVRFADVHVKSKDLGKIQDAIKTRRGSGGN